MQPQRIKDIDVVNVDIAPTILDFCGLKDMKTHGISFMPRLNESKEYKAQDFVKQTALGESNQSDSYT